MNGYPDHVVHQAMQAILEPDTTTNRTSSKRIITKLPWLGHTSSIFRKKIQQAIVDAFPATTPIICFSTRTAFPRTAKEALPTLEKSNFIYNYACSCEETYVGRTSQRFKERIRQHVPDKLLLAPSLYKPTTADSAITKHLICSHDCLPATPSDRFKVLTRGRTAQHLATLEAIYIKKLSPSLCTQKRHLKSLQLFWCNLVFVQGFALVTYCFWHLTCLTCFRANLSHLCPPRLNVSPPLAMV